MQANSAPIIEWIVVDDGSGSAYDPVFDQLRALPVNIIRMQENRRQGAARNEGFRRSKGDWIKFLDADDMLDDDHLQALLMQAERQLGIPFAPTRHVYADGSLLDNMSWKDLPDLSEPQLERLIHSPFLHHCGTLFPRKLLQKIGGYDEHLVTDEDGDLLIRVLQTGAHFVPVPEVRYFYNHDVGPNRVSKDIGFDKLQSRLRVCEKIESSFYEKGKEMPATLKHALAQRLDKIALSYWQHDRCAARKVLARAQAVYPGYRPAGGKFSRIIRRLGGASATVYAAKIFRRLRRRPKGGMQG